MIKKINNIPQQGFVYNIINKLINTINELIEGGGGVPQWLIDLINTKITKVNTPVEGNIVELTSDGSVADSGINKNDIALKNGIYEELTSGNLVGRNTDATYSENSSFIYRTTGGDANLSDANGKLLKVEGNVVNVVDGSSNQFVPFAARQFKSIGFNHFNPENIIKGYTIDETTRKIVEGTSNDSILLVRCVACTASAEAGYEFTYDDGISVNIHKVAYSKLKPVIGQEFELSDILVVNTHRNSTSYLPTQAGWLAISIVNNNVGELDHSKLCVHICWSGYNDGKFEEYIEASPIEIPYNLVHNWGLGKAGSVKDILNYQTKEWTKKVSRTKPELEYMGVDKTVVEESDGSGRLYTLTGISSVTLVDGQIGGSITININNLNDVNTSRIATFVSRSGDMDTWTYREYDEQTDPEVEPTYTDYTVITDSIEYYNNKPTLGVWIIESNIIDDAKVLGQFSYNTALLSDITLDVDEVFNINSDKKFRTVYNYNNELDYGQTQIEHIVNRLSDEYLYYELETYETGTFDVDNNSERWDFGVEYFDDYAEEGELYQVAATNVDNSYTGFLLDDIRALKSRDLQDRIKNIYVIETSTIPTGSYTFNSPMTAANTLWHYHHEATGETTVDVYYQYNNGTYSTVPYKIRPNYYHIWQGTITDLVLQLEAIASEEKQYYNEYMIEFTTASTGTPSVTFPSTLKWNTTPSIETSHTYQVSIVNNIGCIIAVNKSAS